MYRTYERNVLPELWIELDEDFPEFSARVRKLVSRLESVSFLPATGNGKTSEQRAFFLVAQEPVHRGLRAWLSLAEDTPRRLRVRIVANEWVGGDPTYDTYVRSARDLLEELVAVYQKHYGRTLRLRAQPRSSTRIHLSPAASELLEHFVANATKDHLHLSEWELLYDFAWYCHRYRVRLREEDLVAWLRNAGFSEHAAVAVGDVYFHLRRFLAGQSKRGPRIERRSARRAEGVSSSSRRSALHGHEE